MIMENIADWIEHLKHPLVLAGFGLLVLSVLLKPMFSNSHTKLSGRATERLMSKAIILVFVLALLLIIAGFVLSLKPDTPATEITQQPVTTTQNVSGTGAAAINAGGDVMINKGNGVLSSEKKQTTPASDKKPQSPSAAKQTVTGDNATAINAGGDVHVNESK
jgi:hypothetical protein